MNFVSRFRVQGDRSKILLSCLSLKRFPQYSSRPRRKDPAKDIFPENPLKEYFGASFQPTNGRIYDNKPFKMKLKAGKIYQWCLCGHSKTQPICDGSHHHPMPNVIIPQRPIFFKVPEDKEYWLCNCKQTKHRPFCDGTHRRQDIKDAVKS